MATPLIGSSNAQPSARASPDFGVTGLTFEGAGSIAPGTGTILEPAQHNVRVTVRNSGDAPGGASLQLVHKGSPTAGEFIVTTIALGDLPAGSTSNPISIPWTATTGDDQTLFARISSTSASDPNPANNEQRQDFDVKNNHSGIILEDSIPVPEDGNSFVTLARGLNNWSATVQNNGVKNISAVMQVTLKSQTLPVVTHVFWSNTQILPSGSIFSPAAPKNLSISFDTAALSGLWDLKVEYIYNGTLWTYNPVTVETTARVSSFTASLSSLGDRSIEPGQTGTLTFLLRNTGEPDTFKITSITSTPANRQWADVSTVGTQLSSIPRGGTLDVQIPVTIPSNEARANAAIIEIVLESQESNESYTLTSVAVVQAGESYSTTIEMPATVTKLDPGAPSELKVNVTNTGNVDGFFSIDCGLSVAAINWELAVAGIPCADVEPIFINRSTSTDIYLNVTAPSIKSPLDPGEFNLAGQPLQVWMQVRSEGGGLPNQAAASVEIKPIIVVDPGFQLSDNVITLSKEQVRAARNGQGLEDVLDMNVQVRHNLDSNLDENLSATLSVSDTSFIAANTGGFEEATRWVATVSPPTLTDLVPSAPSEQNAMLTIQGPDDDYPLAGTHTLSVTVVPTLGGVHIGSGVKAIEVTQEIQIVVPSVLGGEIIDNGEQDVAVASQSPVILQLANTGNDLTSYRLRVSGVPSGWDVDFNGTSHSIDNLSADVANYPSLAPVHITTGENAVELLVTTNSTALANSIVPLTITVEERDTGIPISEYTLPIKVGDLRNASLVPLTQSITLAPNDFDKFRTIQITNTGNSPTTYYVNLDTSGAGDVIFELESNPSFLVAPGFSDVIKIAVLPTSSAIADVNYTGVIEVVDASGSVNITANITANISKSSDIRLDGPSIVGVTPGEMAKVEFNVTNIGNLQESIRITPLVEGNWTTDVTEIGMTLSIEETLAGQIIVNVPSMGGTQSLSDGSVYNLSISVYDASSGAYKTGLVIQLKVGAVFSLEAEGWPNEMEFFRQGTRTWDLTLLNTGNRDVEVAVGYSINRPGLDLGSSSWAMVDGAASKVYLPVGVPISHIFSVEALDFEPDLSLSADLKIFYSPVDATVEGNYTNMTTLSMSRFFSTGDIILRPVVGDPVLEEEIPFSHIPYVLGDSNTTTSYQIELCAANRLLDFNSLNLNDADYPWSFSIVVPGQSGVAAVLPIDTANCNSGTQGESARIELPNRQAWDTTKPLQVLVDAPDRPNILSGDGWELTFRLYNDNEHQNYTVYEEETFSFLLDVFADPMVEFVAPLNIEEGAEFDLKLNVLNAGTATALGVDVALVCPDAAILSSPLAEPMIGVLGPGTSFTLTWRIQPNSIDWWEQSERSECTATVDAFYMDKNVVGNDVRTIEINVESSSPGVSVSFIALIVCFITSFILIQLTRQNEKFRLLAVYAGVLGFGFAFHVLSFTYWGPAVLALTALWIWRMSWSSTDEFKLIHEDYQRARRGVSTLYADHFDALRDSRRQLSVILAVPVLGFIAVVLGLPPQLYNDQTNLVSILVYIAVVMVGVWVIIMRADRAYGNLYGRLTDVEVKATRIERDLGDPARLFNELAGDGLNLDEIFGDVSSTATVGSLVNNESTPEEVNEDG